MLPCSSLILCYISFLHAIYFAVNSGIILTFCAHIILALFPNYSFIPYIATSLMGIAYSMSAIAIWPLIALIVPEYQLGTAFGM